MKISYRQRLVIQIVIALFLHISVSVAEENKIEATKKCEQKLSVDQFRALAFRNSPMLAEIDREYAEELAKAFETEVLVNPELGLERSSTRMKLDGADDSQNSVSLSQPLSFSDFGAKEKVATLIRKSGSVQKRTKLLELNQRLLLNFYSLYVLQEIKRIVSLAEERSGSKVELIRRGVSKGLLSVGDEKLFEGEKHRLRAQIVGISASIFHLHGEITKILGSPCSVIAIAPRKFAEIASENTLLTKAKNSELSELSRLKLLGNLIVEQKRLARLDSYPKVTPKLIYEHTNDGGDFFGVGISVSLPFWNRNQAERIRLKADSEMLKKQKEFLASGGFESQIRNLREAALGSKKQAEIFQSQVIPAFRAALSSQEKLYAEGRGNILQVWQMLRTLNEAELQSLTAWLEAVTAQVQLSVLIGEEV